MSNTYIQLRFTSYDSLGDFLKSLKTFVTYDIDDHKYISSGISIDFDEFTKRCANKSGGQNIQTTLNDNCTYNGAKLILANMSPLRPRPDTSMHLLSTFGRLDIDEGNPLHLFET